MLRALSGNKDKTVPELQEAQMPTVHPAEEVPEEDIRASHPELSEAKLWILKSAGIFFVDTDIAKLLRLLLWEISGKSLLSTRKPTAGLIAA